MSVNSYCQVSCRELAAKLTYEQYRNRDPAERDADHRPLCMHLSNSDDGFVADFATQANADQHVMGVEEIVRQSNNHLG